MAKRRTSPAGDGAVVRRSNYGSENPRFTTGCCRKSAGVVKTPVRAAVEETAQSGMSVPPEEAEFGGAQSGRASCLWWARHSSLADIDIQEAIRVARPEALRWACLALASVKNHAHRGLWACHPTLAAKHDPSPARRESMSLSASTRGFHSLCPAQCVRSGRGPSPHARQKRAGGSREPPAQTESDQHKPTRQPAWPADGDESPRSPCRCRRNRRGQGRSVRGRRS